MAPLTSSTEIQTRPTDRNPAVVVVGAIAVALLATGSFACRGQAESSSPTPASSGPSTTPPAPTSTAAPDTYRVYGLVADEARLYFVDSDPASAGSGRLLSWANGAGAVTVLFAGEADYRLVDALAVDDAYVYFAETPLQPGGVGPLDRVLRVPKQGGRQAELLATTAQVRALAVDDRDLFLSVMDATPNDDILAMAKTGGATTTLATKQLWADAIVSTPTDVVWTTYDLSNPSAAGIYRTAKDGSAPVTTVIATANTSSLATDGRSVYYIAPLDTGTDGDCTSDADVRRVPLAGGEPETLAHAEPGAAGLALAHDPASLAPTNDAVVFTDVGRFCNLPRAPIGQVRSVSLGTGAVTTLASNVYIGWTYPAASGTSTAFFSAETGADTGISTLTAAAIH